MTRLEFDGYIGTAELSEADGVFHGKLANIRDLVTYEADTAAGLLGPFHEAVGDYLAHCKAANREADKPFNGQFQVRTKPDVHRALARMALKRGVSFNEVISTALESIVQEEEKHAS
jgi:predicted HicB family RNase H-like nuclease